MNLAVAAADFDLVPPADALRAQIAAVNPRLRTVAAYDSALTPLEDADTTKVVDGMTITLPNPFKEFPDVGAALRRAKSRSSRYGAGNMAYFRWLIGFSQFTYTFNNISDRISAEYKAMAAGGPTAAQRAEVLKLFAALLRTLSSDRQFLVDAEKSFVDALALLEEDKTAFSESAPTMNRVIQRYEERIRDEVLRLSMYPTTRGLATIMSKAGGAQLDHLRQMRTAITTATDACGKAHHELGLLAGSVLSIVGRYQGVENALKQAEDSAFAKYLGQFRLNVARDTWSALCTFAMSTISG